MTKHIPSFIGLLLLSFLFLSCDKGCDLPPDLNKGTIVPNAIVWAGNTGGIASAHHGPSTQYDFSVSFDKGYTYVPVDWSKYSILNFPVVAGCNTQYERETTLTGAGITYKITLESCPDCETEYRTDNWVLVNKFPQSYPVTYIKKVK